MTTFTEAYKEALVSADTNKAILETIEVYHSQFPGAAPVRLVSDFEPHVCTLEASAPIEPSQPVLFSAGFFRFIPPKRTSTGYTPARLAIDNVDQVMQTLANARGSNEPIQVIWRPYLSDDLSAPQIDPPLKLWLTNTTATLQSVTGTIAAPTIIGRAHPSDLITPQRFPALVR